MRRVVRALWLPPVALMALMTSATGAYGYGDAGDMAPAQPGPGPSGNASGGTLSASASTTRIQVRQISGGSSGGSRKPLAPVDPDWQPPACWYEPVATPQQLKDAVDRLKKGGDLVPVTPSLSWGEELMVDHYEKHKAEVGSGDGYENYNLDKKGYFWRGVINESRRSELDSMDCERTMFWQDAGTLPADKHAPTPDVLAAYAYDKVHVPQTEIEVKPQGQSTVNLPTWVWLGKAKFQEVKVRAELPEAGVWAETTAKPVALHLYPGTADAQTYPASGDCPINADGSIGTPYTAGNAGKTPPCGITYLRASDGRPYQLKASITWRISWEGSGGAKGDLPDGVFETTQAMSVREIQAVNR